MVFVLRSFVTGPLEPYVSEFAELLSRQGYTRCSLEQHIGFVAHLDRWMTAEQFGLTDLSGPVVERYLRERRAAGYANYRSVKALQPLLGYLAGLSVLPPTVPAVVGPVDVLLERFVDYLLSDRALTVGTARCYADAVRPFLDRRSDQDGLGLERLTAADVTGFVVEFCPGRPNGTAKLAVCALRSLLGFFHVEGLIAAPLARTVPSVAGWRLAGLPKTLEPSQLRRLLASCDRRTAMGRRDFAMLMLLARLGLRRGEVAALMLDDIDWRVGELLVHGKGDRADRLPLPVDVGEAITGYLRRGRPATTTGRAVFVRVRAPHVGLTPTGVTQAVFAAGRRAGLGAVYAHRLRHTAASGMLRAGVPLPGVGQVLRHRLLLTTAIYAKVDTDALRTLAGPWPGGR